jgi:hypothetical protein
MWRLAQAAASSSRPSSTHSLSHKRAAIHTALADVYIVRDTAHILWGLTIGLALCDHVGGIRR